MAYQFDVFVSYRRVDPLKTWVQKYFEPELRNWVNMVGAPVSVFLDESGIEAGNSFTPVLEHALKHSKIMVPVWAPGYFYSSWCVAELKTMLERERALGYRTAANPRTLIVPVRFSDGQTFPTKLVGDIKAFDFYPFALTAPGWVDSQVFVGFQQQVKTVAERVAAVIADAPAWTSELALVRPHDVEGEIGESPASARPRL